jgi:hypothetical protein
MRNNSLRYFTYTLILLYFFSGCIGVKPYYAKSELNWNKTSPPDSLKLKYSVFLVGDAGKPSDNRQEPTLKLLQKQLFDSTRATGKDTNFSRPEDMVLFLGDNIYESGLPEPDASDRKEKERRMTEQLDVVKNFRGKKIIIPGNHDWNEMRPGGLAAVNREEAFVETYLNTGDTFLPSNGCPGPIELHPHDDLVVIVLDSEWWLHKYEKPIAPDNGCTAGSRFEIIEQVKDILVRNKGKNILLAEHHPLFTNGTHFSLNLDSRPFVYPFAGNRVNLSLNAKIWRFTTGSLQQKLSTIKTRPVSHTCRPAKCSFSSRARACLAVQQIRKPQPRFKWRRC